MHLIRMTRRARRLTQAEIATQAGISLPTLRALERGEGGVRALVAVMQVLDLRWGWAPDRAAAAAALAERRRARGLSQAELAVRLGVSRPTVIALEQDLGATVGPLVKAAEMLGVRPLLRPIPPRRGGLVPATNMPGRDLVMTPPDLAAAVIAHFSDRMAGSVLDPAKGQGAFYDCLPTHLDRHWCEIAEGRDFLDWDRPVDWVMTNPPWSKLRDFTRHAMRLAPNIVWLAPLTNLTTKARLRDLDEAGFGIVELVLLDTPEDWPQSGFQLVAAWLRKGHAGGWAVTRLAR